MAQFDDQLIVSAELVSTTLDTMGYNNDIVQARRQWWRETFTESEHQSKDFGEMRIVVGSKGEGLTSFAESDIDCMVVLGDVVCAEDVSMFESQGINLFQLIHATSPGYARLCFIHGYDKHSEVVYNRVEQASSANMNVEDSPGDNLEKVFLRNLVTKEGKRYLPNSFFLKEMQSKSAYKTIMYKSERGPAISVGNEDIFTTDTVFALRCQCPCFLIQWIERPLDRGWPPKDTVEKVSAMQAHVVPVGCKSSSDQNIEWRICYTLAEVTLVHSFNDTQLKVYMLLKRIAKQSLFDLSPSMTSYVMKNVIMWVSELTPIDNFRKERLIGMLSECLRKLREFVDGGLVPCYMIPERNLLKEDFENSQRLQLLSAIDTLIDEDGQMLLRYEDIRLAMEKVSQAPEVARKESQERDRMEKFAFTNIRTSQALASALFRKRPTKTETELELDERVIHTELHIIELMSFPDFYGHIPVLVK